MTDPATLRRAADALGQAINLICEAAAGAMDDGALAAELGALATANPDIVALDQARNDPAGSLELLRFEKASVERALADAGQGDKT